MRRTEIFIPYVQERTFRDPTATMAVERTSWKKRSLKPSARHVSHPHSPPEIIPVISSPSTEEGIFEPLPTRRNAQVRERIRELEVTLATFKSKHDPLRSPLVEELRNLTGRQPNGRSKNRP